MRKPFMLVLTLLGLSVSAYLAYSHYRVYSDVTYQSFCAVSKALNCDTVSQSPYARVLNVPVPIWAMIGYAFFGALLSATTFTLAPARFCGSLLLLLAAAFSAYSLVLGAISSFLIKSYCLMCIVLYGVNFGLLAAAWGGLRQLRRRAGEPSGATLLKHDVKLLVTHRRGRLLLIILALLSSGVLAFFPPYWTYSFSFEAQDLPKGVTADGHPYLGAAAPRLEITEFADYQCFQCKKMHYLLRRLVAAYPDQIRLVHRHFPLDHQVNPLVREPMYTGSGAMALAAIYAAAHQRFWQMNDLLYNVDRSRGQIDIADLLKEAGITEGTAQEIFAPVYRDRLQQDIQAGLDLGLSGTPSYVIDGNVYIGTIPAGILRQVVKIY